MIIMTKPHPSFNEYEYDVRSLYRFFSDILSHNLKHEIYWKTNCDELSSIKTLMGKTFTVYKKDMPYVPDNIFKILEDWIENLLINHHLSVNDKAAHICVSYLKSITDNSVAVEIFHLKVYPIKVTTTMVTMFIAEEISTETLTELPSFKGE